MTLQDICKAKAQSLGVTYQQISDGTGIPLQTIRNFFSRASKSPSINTAGPICKFLGVSLDEYCSITIRLTPTEEILAAKNNTFKAQCAELEQMVESKNKTIDMLLRGIRTRNHIMLFMGVIIAILLVWAAFTNLACGDIGLFRRVTI